jgi:hypothetical protein
MSTFATRLVRHDRTSRSIAKTRNLPSRVSPWEPSARCGCTESRSNEHSNHVSINLELVPAYCLHIGDSQQQTRLSSVFVDGDSERHGSVVFAEQRSIGLGLVEQRLQLGIGKLVSRSHASQSITLHTCPIDQSSNVRITNVESKLTDNLQSRKRRADPSRDPKLKCGGSSAQSGLSIMRACVAASWSKPRGGATPGYFIIRDRRPLDRQADRTDLRPRARRCRGPATCCCPGRTR